MKRSSRIWVLLAITLVSLAAVYLPAASRLVVDPLTSAGDRQRLVVALHGNGRQGRPSALFLGTILSDAGDSFAVVAVLRSGCEDYIAVSRLDCSLVCDSKSVRATGFSDLPYDWG
jgi:hypothetical protein